MFSSFDPVSPPDADRLDWRAFEPEDLSAIAELSTACLKADGGLPLATTKWYVRSRYLEKGSSNATIGAFAPDGSLAACSALHLTGNGSDWRANCSGQVHPDQRNRGYGAFLMKWNEEQCRALVADQRRIEKLTLVLTSEWLSPAGVKLYTDFGYEQFFAEDVLRYDLGDGPPASDLLSAYRLITWNADHALRFFAVYDDAFRDRPGNPGWRAHEWIEWVTEDDEFLPHLSFLALSGDTPVGYVISAEDWIVQVGVRPQWRRRGIATGLIAQVLAGMESRGGEAVWLNVNVNNPTATSVYVEMGFKIVGRRARFAREIAV